MIPPLVYEVIRGGFIYKYIGFCMMYMYER